MSGSPRKILIPSDRLIYDDDLKVVSHSFRLKGGVPANIGEGRPQYSPHNGTIFHQMRNGALTHFMETSHFAEVQQIQAMMEREYFEALQSLPDDERAKYKILPHPHFTVDETVWPGDELVTYGLGQPTRYSFRGAIFTVLA